MAVVVGTTASLAFISVRWPQESRDDTGILILIPPTLIVPPSVPRRPNKKAIKAVAELYEGDSPQK